MIAANGEPVAKAKPDRKGKATGNAGQKAQAALSAEEAAWQERWARAHRCAVVSPERVQFEALTEPGRWVALKRTFLFNPWRRHLEFNAPADASRSQLVDAYLETYAAAD